MCNSLHNLLTCVGPAACLCSADEASYAASCETSNQGETGLTDVTTHLVVSMFSVLGLITMTKDDFVCLLCITYLHKAGMVNWSGK